MPYISLIPKFSFNLEPRWFLRKVIKRISQLIWQPTKTLNLWNRRFKKLLDKIHQFKALCYALRRNKPIQPLSGWVKGLAPAISPSSRWLKIQIRIQTSQFCQSAKQGKLRLNLVFKIHQLLPRLISSLQCL